MRRTLLLYLSGYLSSILTGQGLYLILISLLWPALQRDDPQSPWSRLFSALGGKSTASLYILLFVVLSLLLLNYLLHTFVFRTEAREIHRMYAAAILLHFLLYYLHIFPELWGGLLSGIGIYPTAFLLICTGIVLNLLCVRQEGARQTS